jgi:hypothetical protein
MSWTLNVTHQNDRPKFFATSKASSGVFAAMLFGVGIPYYFSAAQRSAQ